MTMLEPRLILGPLEKSIFSANMGTIYHIIYIYITRKRFFSRYKNCLSNRILELCCCWSFPNMHMIYLFWNKIIFEIFSSSKTSFSVFFCIWVMWRILCDSRYLWFINIIISISLTVTRIKHIRLGKIFFLVFSLLVLLTIFFSILCSFIYLYSTKSSLAEHIYKMWLNTNKMWLLNANKTTEYKLGDWIDKLRLNIIIAKWDRIQIW